VTLSFGVVPGGNAVRVQVIPSTPIALLASSERIAPLATATLPATFDASSMLPAIDSLALDGARGLRWTGGGSGGTITVVEAIAGGVQWDFYLEPAATSVHLPDLPADLGVPMPDSADVVSVVKLDVPGVSRTDLLPTIDRRWSRWPHDATLFPPAGSSLARILYSAALGPPP
jgi:hypothetical protein